MRLIDADALLEEAKRISGPVTGDGWDNFGVYALIERQKTVDAVPVVHSCWIELDKGFYVCGNCRNFFTQHKEWSYCPNCGAVMNGG